MASLVAVAAVLTCTPPGKLLAVPVCETILPTLLISQLQLNLKVEQCFGGGKEDGAQLVKCLPSSQGPLGWFSGAT